MQFSPEQDNALKQVARWLENPEQPVFRLFGFAGTGKTTLAKHFAEGVEGQVAFGAFTGKAAYVLRSKGCENASTIHSMIYICNQQAATRLQSLETKLVELRHELLSELGNPDQVENHHQIKELKAKIKKEDENSARPRFRLNLDSDIRKASLVVIDECSMVDGKMGEDLLSFKIPVLVLGDPAQLPPVAGGGFFTNGEPNIMLTEIHRQARENPILRLATQARNGEKIKLGDYGDGVQVIEKSDLTPDHALETEQFLVGKNKTRHAYNARLRALRDLPKGLPVEGDRLVCLRNDHDKGLLNGSIWSAESYEEIDEDSCLLRVSSLDMPDVPSLDCEAHTHYFQGRGDQLHWTDKRNAQEFDFAYAMTCHKSQGSQWDDVTVIDESSVFREHAKNWIYTAITRAAKKLTIAR